MLTKENISDHPAKQFHTVATALELLLAICPPPFRQAKLFFIYPKVYFIFKKSSFSIRLLFPDLF